MSNTVDIAIYHSEADNKSGWVNTLSDFLGHYLKQKKVNPTSIQQITFNDPPPASAKIALVILSNETSNISAINIAGDIIYLIKKADVNIPSSLDIRTTYQLFEKDPESDKTTLYRANSSSEIESLYWMKLLDIASDIYQALYSSNSNTVKGKTIYIAETSEDQTKNRDKIKRELIDPSSK